MPEPILKDFLARRDVAGILLELLSVLGAFEDRRSVYLLPGRVAGGFVIKSKMKWDSIGEKKRSQDARYFSGSRPILVELSV